MPVRNSLLSAPVSTPASPIKATSSLLMAPLQHVLSRYGDVKSMPFCNYGRTDAFENIFKAR